MSYQAPDSTIYQTLRVSSPSVGRRNVLIVGPQYDLQLNDGREMDKRTYEGAATTALRLKSGDSWVPVTTGTHIPDENSIEIWGENLRAKVTPASIAAFLRVNSNTLRLSSGAVYLAPSYSGPVTLNAGLDGRAVKVGDIVVVSDDPLTVTRTRKVVALLPKVTPSSYTENDMGDGEWLASSPGTYALGVSRTFRFEIIAVLSGGDSYLLRILDTAGIIPVIETTVDKETDFAPIPGSGLTFSLPDALLVGAEYSIDVVAASTSSEVFDALLLDGPVPDSSSLDVDIYQSFSGKLSLDNVDGFAAPVFTLTGAEVETPAFGLKSAASGADTSFVAFEEDQGQIFVAWRGAVIPASTEAQLIAADSLTDDLGENHYSNNVSACAYSALVGVADSPTPIPAAVFALRTAGDTPEAYLEALAKIKGVDRYYAIVAATDNEDVKTVLRDHVLAYSGPRKKMWRKLYVACESPGDTELWGVLERGTKLQAQLDDGVVTIVAEDEGLKSFLDDAVVGDLITIGGFPIALPITRIISASEVEVSGAGSTILVGGLSLIRKAGVSTTKAFVRAKSVALRDRRVVNVWCDRALDGAGRKIPNICLASYEAGVRAASIPQLGRTRGKVSIVTSAPTMYTLFDDDDLNDIAEVGTYIITQASTSGDVFVRHQLTTENTKGLLYAEDNVTVIGDKVAYQLKDIVDTYIGQRNATKFSLDDLQAELRAMVTGETQVEKQWTRYGPPIVTFFDEDGVESNVTVRQDPVLADHIYTYTRLRVPVPINGVISYLDYEVSFVVG